MKLKEVSIIKRITRQLELIDDINKDIESSKEVGSKLMVRQYEHLKNQFVKNLFEMIAKNYQIPMPILAKKEAA